MSRLIDCPTCEGSGATTAEAGAPFVACPRCCDGVIDIVAGMTFEWHGLPGQHPMNARIEVGSMTASCGLNARILDPGEDGEEPSVVLCTIAAADFYVAVSTGWLLPLGGQSP